MYNQQSLSYDQIMEQKIKMLEIAEHSDPSLSCIHGLPSTKRHTNRSTQLSESFRQGGTPQFSERKTDHFSSPRKAQKVRSITQEIISSPSFSRSQHVSFEQTEQKQQDKMKNILLESGDECIPSPSKKENSPTFLDSFEFSEILQKNYQTGKTNVNTTGTKRSLLLYEHAKKLHQKNNTLKMVKVKEELNGCTFVPQVLDTLKTTPNSTQVFERLAKPRKIHTQSQQEEKDELEGCTFRPQINQKTIVPQNNLEDLRGVKSQLKRWETARKEQERVKNFYENQNKRMYDKNMKSAQPQPFNLSQTNRNTNGPIIYLDVTVSKNKVGRLGVRKGDNIEDLVKTFSKTYTLSIEAQDKLKALLQQVMCQYYGNTLNEI